MMMLKKMVVVASVSLAGAAWADYGCEVSLRRQVLGTLNR